MKKILPLLLILLSVSFAFLFLSSDVYAVKCATGGCTGCTPNSADIDSCVVHHTSPDHCFSPSGPAHSHTITDGGGSVTCCQGQPGEQTLSPTCGASSEHSGCCPGPPPCSDSQPDTPNIGAPTDMSVHSFGAITFDWDMSGKSWGKDCDGNDRKFEFELDDNFDFSSPDFSFVFDDTETSTTYAPRGGMNDYYWRVRARQGITTPQYSNWAGPNWFLLDGCSTNLTVTPMCGAAWDEADFDWDEPSGGTTKYVLRVNYEDLVVPEWMSTHDFWKLSENVGSCGQGQCSATLDDNSINHGGNADFAEGHYLGWSIQTSTVQGESKVCRNDDWSGGTCNSDSMDLCQVQGGAFDCNNSAPSCTVSGPSSVYWNETHVYTATNISDPDGDPVAFDWWFAASGTFSNILSNPTNWTAPISTAALDIIALVNDGDLPALCSKTVDVLDPSPSCSGFLIAPPTIFAGNSDWWHLSVSDPNGGPIESDWIASCTGGYTGIWLRGAHSLNNANLWQAPSVPNITCTLSGTPFDGTWTGNTCSVNVDVIDPSPSCTSITGPSSVYSTDVNLFTVEATDPQGLTISSDWTAACEDSLGNPLPSGGTFNPLDGRSTSQNIDWSAPIGAALCTLNSTVKNSDGWTGNTCTKVVTVNDRVVQGWIWDSTGEACNYGNKQGAEIQPGDVDGAFTPTLAWSGGTLVGNWDPASYSGHSYEVPGAVIENNQILCAPPPSPHPSRGLDTFRYKLACLNNSKSGVISGSCASVDVAGVTATANLGYELISNGWFTSIAGDVFSGANISAGMPVSPLGGFFAADNEAYMVLRSGTVMSGGDLSIKDRFDVDKYSEDNNRYAKNMKHPTDPNLFVDMWPVSYDFVRPPNAIQLPVSGTTCTNILNAPSGKRLDPDEVYYVDFSCMNTAIRELRNEKYKLKGDGVVVIYITGAGQLYLGVDGDGNGSGDLIQAQNDKRRIVLVSAVPVYIDSELGSMTPDISDRPHIEMGIIAQGVTTFDSVGDTSGDTFSDDTTVILEAPLLSSIGISFDRDRGLDNNYPAEVIETHLGYIDALTSQERTSSIPNYTGLSVVNINWIPAE